MKHVLVIAILLSSTLSFADNRESGGGGPNSGPKLQCQDQFATQNSKIFMTAQIVNAAKLANLVIRAPSLKGETLRFSSFGLNPTDEGGLPILVGSVHASGISKPDFSVILSFGSNWLATAQSGQRIVGEMQFYCDECGGGNQFFQPNMYCTVTK